MLTAKKPQAAENLPPLFQHLPPLFYNNKILSQQTHILKKSYQQVETALRVGNFVPLNTF